jgi:hypothetical protein
MTLNIQKKNFLLIKNYQNPTTLFDHPKIENSFLTEATSTRFLGIVIDQTLSWSEQINNLRNQLHKSLGLIYRASSFMPRTILILLYSCLVNSKIIYCIESWGSAVPTHLNKILTIQKKFYESFPKKVHVNTPHLFRVASVLPVKQLYTLRICLLAHNDYYKYNLKHSLLTLLAILLTPFPCLIPYPPADNGNLPTNILMPGINCPFFFV